MAIFEERIAQKELEKEKEAENYAARIETLNGYKESIQERLTMIGQNWDDYQASLDAEAKWEAALFNDMASEIEAYASRVEDAMRRAQEAKAEGGAPDYSGNKTTNNSGHSSDYYDKKNNVDKDRLDKLASGGTAYHTGICNVDELGDELIVPPPKHGKFKLLEMGSKVFGAGMSQQMMQSFHDQSNMLATEHFSASMKALNMQAIGVPQGGQTINIGDIIIQNPIGNVDGLPKAISNRLPTRMIQTAYNR